MFVHPERGTTYRYETFSGALRAAYAAAGLDYPEGMRPFHDLRVTSITNDAIAGANPVALMTKAGQREHGDDSSLPAARGRCVRRRG